MQTQPGYSHNGRQAADRKILSRPLNMDFDLYTEGDQEYKTELCSLMIVSLQDLQQSLSDSIQDHDPGLFLNATHKATVTIDMLADMEFQTVASDLKRDFLSADKDDQLTARARHFQKLCDSIISSLQKEIKKKDLS